MVDRHALMSFRRLSRRQRAEDAAAPQQARARRRSGWEALRSYPVEGDSAEYELWFGERIYAVMWLEGIDLEAEGEARTTAVSVRVEFLEGCEVDWDELQAHLAAGREWLIENEQGRLPH